MRNDLNTALSLRWVWNAQKCHTDTWARVSRRSSSNKSKFRGLWSISFALTIKSIVMDSDFRGPDPLESLDWFCCGALRRASCGCCNCSCRRSPSDSADIEKVSLRCGCARESVRKHCDTFSTEIDRAKISASLPPKCVCGWSPFRSTYRCAGPCPGECYDAASCCTL